MMDATQKLICCEIRILEAINIELTSPKNLFIRYYLSAGNNKRIRLNTRQISSTNNSDFVWNESFSLECLGTQDSIHGLKQSTVIFELRQAKTLPLLNRISGSQLLGRAEIPWEQVFGSPNMEIEKWVCFCLVREGFFKQPKLKVGMRVRVNEMVMENKKKRFGKWKDECGCKSEIGHSADHDFFAIAVAMEFF